MQRFPILALFVFLMTGLMTAVYASLVSYPAAVPAALQESRNLVLLGETVATMLVIVLLVCLMFLTSRSVLSTGGAATLALSLAVSGYGIFVLMTSPGLLF